MVSVHLSYEQKDFSSALQKKEEEVFWTHFTRYLLIVIFVKPLTMIHSLLNERLALKWQQHLTCKLSSSYLVRNAACRLKSTKAEIDNPDERILSSTMSYVDTALDLTSLFSGNLLKVTSFSAVLWSIEPSLFFFMFGYGLFGILVSWGFFGKRVLPIKKDIAKRGASLRYCLVRVRENAEAIAFLKGEAQELQQVMNRMSEWFQARTQRMYLNWGKQCFSSLYTYGLHVFPLLLLVKRYFADDLEFGSISQATKAFFSVYGALIGVFTKVDVWTDIAVTTDRLHQIHEGLGIEETQIDFKSLQDWRLLLRKIKEVFGKVPISNEPEHEEETSDNGAIIADGKTCTSGARSNLDADQPIDSEVLLECTKLDVVAPGQGGALEMGPRLIQGLDLVVRQSDSFLITGPSGCGKTSLFRTIAGVGGWAPAKGSAVATQPEKTAFLPQKPFMTLGSFLSQLYYPNVGPWPSGEVPKDGHTNVDTWFQENAAEAARLLEAVNTACLGPVVAQLAKTRAAARTQAEDSANEAAHPSDRFRGPGEPCSWTMLQSVLNLEEDWTDVLSLGEQQRVAFARLFLQRPKLAFLDEATAALDESTEAILYSRLKALGCALVSISHSIGIVRHHTHVLHMKGQSWEVLSGVDFAKSHLEAK